MVLAGEKYYSIYYSNIIYEQIFQLLSRTPRIMSCPRVVFILFSFFTALIKITQKVLLKINETIFKKKPKKIK